MRSRLKGVTVLLVQDQKLRIVARTILLSQNLYIPHSLKSASNFSYSSSGLHTLGTRGSTSMVSSSNQKVLKSPLVV